MMKRAETFSKRNGSQLESELNGFIQLLKERNVRSYLEIGARHGDTFHAVMSSLPRGSLGIAVDLPGGLWGTRSSRESLSNAVVDLKQKGYEIHCRFGDSQTDEMRSIIEEYAPFDAVFIDGDHTLAGVTKDWNNYKNMTKIVAFHDIVGWGQFEKVQRRKVEVPILWKEIKDKYKSGFVEFIEDGSPMGIGVCLL